DAGAVVALIEERAGLLPGDRLDLEPDAVLDARHGRARLAADDARLRLEPFDLGDAAGGGLLDRARAEARADRVEHHLLAALHRQRGHLHDRGVAEHVDDEPGQAVALRAYQAVAGRALGGQAKPPAQRARLAEPRGDPRGVERLVAPGGEP